MKKGFSQDFHYFLRRSKNDFLSTFFPVYNTKRIYKSVFGKKISLENPATINEKIQYLKLKEYYKNDLVTICCDKYRVRDYLEKSGFAKLLPTLYGVYDKPSQIEWDVLPEKYVIKCNHGSGYNIFVEDGKKVDKERITFQLKKWLKEDYWKQYAEVQYKFVKKQIIIEEYLGKDIDVIKFYCFNGSPEFLYIAEPSGPNKLNYIDYFDMNYNHMEIRLGEHFNNPNYLCYKKPKDFGEMVKTAESLSKPFPFVRVDFNTINNRTYFSEFTFTPTGGFMKFSPEGIDVRLGKL